MLSTEEEESIELERPCLRNAVDTHSQVQPKARSAMGKVWAELALQFSQYPFHAQVPAGLPVSKKETSDLEAASSGLPSECISGRFMWVIY